MAKICPECMEFYDDQAVLCDEDGTRLVFTGTIEASALVGTAVKDRFHLTKLVDHPLGEMVYEAFREIADMLEKKILYQLPGKGRSVRYDLVWPQNL